MRDLIDALVKTALIVLALAVSFVWTWFGTRWWKGRTNERSGKW